MEKVDFYVPPELGVLERSLQYLMPGTPRHHREGLTEIATKEDSDTSKRFLHTKDIPKGAIDSLNRMFVLHRNLIPNDDASLA
jgi:hypothetical protein